MGAADKTIKIRRMSRSVISLGEEVIIICALININQEVNNPCFLNVNHLKYINKLSISNSIHSHKTLIWLYSIISPVCLILLSVLFLICKKFFLIWFYSCASLFHNYYMHTREKNKTMIGQRPHLLVKSTLALHSAHI
jgi:hypothetical protein